MLKNCLLSLFFLILGIISFFLGIKLGGLFLGIGAGLIASGIVNLFAQFFYQKHPQIKAKKDIEVNDERNLFIRYKACFKAYEISKWFLLALAVVGGFLDFPLWLILSLLCIYIYNAFLQVYFINKFNQEI